MQNKITGRNDLEKKLFNNSINLLVAKKERSLNCQESRYKMAIITDSIRTFLNTKQKESESLQDYTRRYKTAKEIMESHIGGPIILIKYIELTEEYKVDIKTHQNIIVNGIITYKGPNTFEDKNTKKAASKLYAYIYLENSDKSKYESILKNLNQQNSFGNNQYPKSITEANNVLNNHKFDGSYMKSRQTQREQSSKIIKMYKKTKNLYR